MSLRYYIRFLLSVLILFFALPANSFISDKEIATFQKSIANKPIGKRIALWAEKFVGTPYDPDPLGEYVTKNIIVADERVDCMYLSFRAVELAMSLTPEEAIKVALDKRFMNKGRLAADGRVLNYEDRFQYGEDMLDSGKWGEEITEEIGEVTEIEGARGRSRVRIISRETLLKNIKGLRGQRGKVSDIFKDGDFVFFIKAPERRIAGEIVGHIGIIKLETSNQQSTFSRSGKDKEIYLIHAGGVKNKGRNLLATSGKVKKVRLFDYLSSMSFIGIRVSRFH